tara:strand:- start:3170 stop:3451 length:282 start_codon:yes stop_codon:yes gene_type:complete
MIWKGLTVEIIRIIWSHGYFVDNQWLQMIHKNFWCYWVDYKTSITLKDVDKQIEKLSIESTIDPPVFTEEVKGETPLGGKMKLKATWVDEKID